MALTQERATVITEFLEADLDRAKKLFDLGPDAALKEINAAGNDFTIEEINEYGEAAKKASAQGELDADALDNVAGGSFVAAGVMVGIAIGRAW